MPSEFQFSNAWPSSGLPAAVCFPGWHEVRDLSRPDGSLDLLQPLLSPFSGEQCGFQMFSDRHIDCSSGVVASSHETSHVTSVQCQPKASQLGPRPGQRHNPLLQQVTHSRLKSKLYGCTWFASLVRLLSPWALLNPLGY